ncbi:SDR family oxidoreductase [Halorussus gelatinilyticus]|uniref:SDR family oxidoreductase n=1 Tax=Halorussus gelatinilyticus TaxID=2937524 RepID=A0A8U0IF95_9EURY|nr:SDR family oxidoreductase [Halorussus gelatinilyticus]UPV99567.1 SDR family oxidoreductase [Halorussus gelatinilyticus]
MTRDESPCILVTGATGTVGSHVVSALANRDDVSDDSDATDSSTADADGGVTVRAGVRDPASAADRFAADVELAEFDFERPETWGEALAGADRLFLMRPPAVSDVKRHITPFVDAAVRTGVERVVYLSVVGAEKNPLLPHRRVERHLESADASSTFLRASFFMQNLNEVHREEIVERDEIFVPAGGGATSFVDARDVGEVAAVALTEPGHGDRSYDVTGPAALTYRQVARVFSAVLDRRIEYADPSIPEFAWRMRRRGFDWSYVAVMVGIYTTARLGLADRVTDDAARVLGREPRTLREYVADYADEFRR